jgi:hypothetical protein
MSDKRQFGLRTTFAGIALVGLLLTLSGFGYRIIGPAVPKSLLMSIKPGMSKAEVRGILGAPKNIVGNCEWKYGPGENVGWVEVWFDAQGRVSHINDESAFP